MAASETAICNQALGLLGEARISAIDANEPAARACNIQFAPSRDFLLRRYDWAFARTRQEIAADSETPIGDEYEYQYSIPAGGALPKALVLRRIIGYKNLRKRDVTREGQKWLINIAGPLKIVYTYQEIDPMKFDPGFEQALTYYIAHRVALPLGKDFQVGAQYLALFEQAFRVAAGLDAEQDPPEPGENPWTETGRGEAYNEIPVPREIVS